MSFHFSALVFAARRYYDGDYDKAAGAMGFLSDCLIARTLRRCRGAQIEILAGIESETGLAEGTIAVSWHGIDWDAR